MIKLNCDMGEDCGVDEAALMPYLDQANIACGYHAGDEKTMHATVALAKQYNVSIGAHPGYADKANFGREAVELSKEEIARLLKKQLIALQSVCRQYNQTIDYIKPHGALYNRMMQDKHLFEIIVENIAKLNAELTLPCALMVMSTPDQVSYQAIADNHKVTLLFEAFCDRVYTKEGVLQSRKEKGAVLETVDVIIKQAQNIIQQQQVISNSGKVIPIAANSLCIHGDHPLASQVVRAIHQLLHGE